MLTANSLDFEQIKEIVPQRFPFLMLDRIIDLEPGVRIVGIKNLTGNEFFYQGHFAASDNGLIAYVPGGDRAIGRLAWVDRRGQTEFLPPPARLTQSPPASSASPPPSRTPGPLRQKRRRGSLKRTNNRVATRLQVFSWSGWT